MLRLGGTAADPAGRLVPQAPRGRPEDDVSGEGLARLFKYLRLRKDPSPGQTGSVPLGRVSAKAFYQGHRKAFDAVSLFFSTHGLDARPYIRFFVCDLAKTGRDVDECLYSRSALSGYAAKLQAAEKREKVYSWIAKSVRNVADMCAAEGYVTGRDCVLALIRSKRLAQEYVAGRISKYFLAAIPSFRDVIPKLDHFARAEFADLLDKFDIYNTEANAACLARRNRVANPLDMVDRELRRRRKAVSAVRSNDEDEDLFDPNL